MYRVKNWKLYQASMRKNRGAPPWRKLHISFFADFHVRLLSESQRFQLLGIFAFCDPKTGVIEKTLEELAHDIGCKSINLDDFRHFIKPVGNHGATTGQPVDGDMAAQRREEESREEDKDHCAEKTSIPFFDDYFDTFWDVYPKIRRRGRGKCEEKIKGYIKNRGIEFIDIIEGLDRWVVSDEWLKEGGKYICAPEAWLNQERWLEYPAGDSVKSESNLEGMTL